jgi:hypothetical protein
VIQRSGARELHGKQLVIRDDDVWLFSDPKAPMVMPDGSTFAAIGEAD